MASTISEVDGIGVDGYDIANNQGPMAGSTEGKRFKVHGQTSNTSAGTIPNQETGTFSLPSGTVGDGTVGGTVSNALLNTNCMIFMMQKGDCGKALSFCSIVVGASSFTYKIRTGDGAATTANSDIWYRIVGP
jgi:hypothetical protein